MVRVALAASALCCLLSALRSPLVAADRPDPDLVRRNVMYSQGEHARRYPPPTQEQAVRRLRESLARLRSQTPAARQSPEQVRIGIEAYPTLFTEDEKSALLRAAEMPPKEWLEWKQQQVRALTEKIRETERDYTPPPRRLARMNWPDLPPGAVGFAGPDPGGRVAGNEGWLVRQVLGPDEFLGEYYSNPETLAAPGERRPPSREILGGLVLVRGIPTEMLTEGRRKPLLPGQGWNMVCVGRYSYIERTVPVLEVFDPSQPFE